KRNNNPNVYFDLKDVLAPLMSKSASEITVSPVPLNLSFAKKYNMTGKVQGVGFRRWIRKKALESDLYGYAQNLRDGSLDVVVAGDEVMVNKFRDTCKQGPKASKVKEISEAMWERPIKIGFEIKSNPKIKKNKEQRPEQAQVNGEQVKKKKTFAQRLKRKIKKV